ncbi:MAG: 5'-nucleotidase C-terminal domain-containing protein [Thiovulaceae bacterium]|nr:5'-nucleotidase C-terminal domain-containing protein [Sulfurimonadaceae bacterium]
MKKTVIAIGVFAVVAVAAAYAMREKPSETTINFAHIGDIHGHLIPRAHVRDDGNGMKQGGLARVYTLIKEMREKDDQLVLINTGDTIQGSAEALYTRGEAMIEVLNAFGIDYYAPGNWDWLYGKERFKELFVGKEALSHWHPLIANIYNTEDGTHLVEPYKIQTIKGVKVGFLGFTSERGPMVVGSSVAKGLNFSNGDAEFKKYVKALRPQVDLLVVLSELGLAKNIALSKAHPGVDFVFSSDMHEETPREIVLENGTVLVEEGQDGTRVGEMSVTLRDHKVVGHKFTFHIVDEKIKPDAEIAALVEKVRAPFVDEASAKKYVNPFSKRHLTGAIDAVIGKTDVDLHRSNFSDSVMPAVVEGSSHDFITDVFRIQSGADIGLLRGFRYGTHIKVGDIHREDIYHYIPIGPFLAEGEMTGQTIKNVIEKSAHGSLSGDVSEWTGGWLFAWSGLHYDLTPNAKKGERATNITVLDKKTGAYLPLNLEKVYTVAGYNYDEEPNRINKVACKVVKLAKNDKGEAIDAIDAIEDYLKVQHANPELNRITIIAPLSKPNYGNREIQPLP